MAPVKRRDLVFAAIAIFIAWGYLTHWQPKLHYLPYAFIAGVLATLALLAWLTFTIAWDRDVRSGGKVDYGPRHVAFVAPDRWKAEREAMNLRNTYMMEPLYPASFMISDSIDVLIGLILRDFVKSWYGSISKSPTFVNTGFNGRSARTHTGSGYGRDSCIAHDTSYHGPLASIV